MTREQQPDNGSDELPRATARLKIVVPTTLLYARAGIGQERRIEATATGRMPSGR